MGRKYEDVQGGIPFSVPIIKTTLNNGIKEIVIETGEWNLKCCDCHLVHNISIIPPKKGKKMQIIMRRDERATAQLRRHRKINLNNT